jgi:hypothetical protein
MLHPVCCWKGGNRIRFGTALRLQTSLHRSVLPSPDDLDLQLIPSGALAGFYLKSH